MKVFGDSWCFLAFLAKTTKQKKRQGTLNPAFHQPKFTRI
jgi:hypothetical protein